MTEGRERWGGGGYLEAIELGMRATEQLESALGIENVKHAPLLFVIELHLWAKC